MIVSYNAQKLTQRQKNEETKGYFPNERTRQKLRKKLNGTMINNLPDRVQSNDHKGAH